MLAGVLALAALFALLFWRIAFKRVHGLSFDVEELSKRLDQSRSKSEALQSRLSDLLDGCGVGVIALNENEVIEQANADSARIFGLPEEDLVGKSLIQAVFSSELQEAVRKTLAQRTATHLEIRGIGPSLCTLRIEVQPQTHGSRGAIIYAHDVTEFRRLETVRRDFVANVSHELRTPLASIRAMAETLESGARKDDVVADRFLATIVTEADRLARISEDLLILSDAESHEPVRSEFDLSRMIEDALLRSQMRADLEGVEITSDIEPSIGISASRDQMEQAVMNLVDNAIKYTASGGTIHVSARREGDEAEIEFSDSGIGILQEDIPRIFERFYRVDKARSRRSGGTGLGLSIVKHVVESHGGRVWVESEFNRGSRFFVSLPSARLPSQAGGDRKSA